MSGNFLFVYIGNFDQNSDLFYRPEFGIGGGSKALQ